MTVRLRIKLITTALVACLVVCIAQATPLPWSEWDHSVEVDQTQGLPAREAAFGPSTNTTRCNEANLPMARLLFPPVSGSFTQAGAQQTLYIYWFCDDVADASVINRVLVIAAGNELVAVVPHSQMRYGGVIITAVAAVDLDGDGLMELVEEHSAVEYSAAHGYYIGDSSTTRMFTTTTTLDTCGMVDSGRWSMELTYSSADEPGALGAFSAIRTYHPCAGIHRIEDWRLASQYEALGPLRTRDPADYARRLLSLAWYGHVDAQLDIARMYREGDVLPMHKAMADWWQEQANVPR